MAWSDTQKLNSLQYTCGYCNSLVASDDGYARFEQEVLSGYIYICHHCDKPTYIIYEVDEIVEQIPPPTGTYLGNTVNHLPSEVGKLYDEARTCAGNASYTAAVMICRKILMHIAVEKGAEPNKSFKEYVDYLLDKHYISPDSKVWVDYIRHEGNEANHEIALKKKHEAMQLIKFVEILTKSIYEFPASISGHSTQDQNENSSEKK